MNKAEQKAKFHATEVVGMTARDRMAGYELRLKKEKSSPFQKVPWRCIGPEVQGGRVIDIDSPRNVPKQTLVAFATGGLWRTEDDGVTWTSLFDQESAYGIGDFAVSKDGKTIWLGSGENNSQRTSYSGTGIFKSVDAGKTWKNMGLPESHHIGRVLIDPRNEETVWVAVLGHLYSQNMERGVYKTTDGGKTWSLVLKGDAWTGAIDLSMDARDGNVVYASTWYRDRRAWDFLEGGPGSNVWKTSNGGKSWTKLTGLPHDSDSGRIGLAVAPSKPDRVYAFFDNQNADADTDRIDERSPDGRLTIQKYRRASLEVLLQVEEAKLKQFLSLYLPDTEKAEDVLKKLKDGTLKKDGLSELFAKKNPNLFNMRIRDAEVWRSDDAGKTWKNVSGRMGAHGGYYGGNITVSPFDPDDVYTAGLFLLRSKDGGHFWEMAARGAHVDFHVTYVDPRDPNRVWTGSDGGIFFSGDGGQNFRHINNLAVGQFTTIAVDEKTPFNVYGGLQDNGTMKGPSTYVPGQSDPNAWTEVSGGDGSAIAIDPRDGGDTVYTASQWGAHSATNQLTKERWNARAPGDDLRYNWISPILISPHHPDIVYLGSQKVHRSFNQGKKYEALSGDLSKNRPNGNVPHSSLTTLSESPFKFGLLYGGTDDGNLWVTPDGGSTWNAINTPQPELWVTRVVASKWEQDTVLCSQNGYRSDDFRPYVWRSKDRGKTWESISGDLPAECVNTVREDPIRKDVLWVGTDMGVYVTFDGGNHWDTYGVGLPHTPVHDLVVQAKAKTLVIASHARSVWAISTDPVVELTDEIRAKEVHWFTNFEIDWNERWGYAGRSEWDHKDPTEPTANARMWTTLGGPAKLVVKDKDGKTVKSIDLVLAPGFNWLSIGMQTGPGSPDAAGVFDPPKSGEEALRDPYKSRRPQYLSKGEYAVEITVGGKSIKTTLKIK